MTRTVVIGGGIAGLASAALLAREGHQVTLLEKNAALGGRAGSWAHEGFRFDTGPSWYLMPECFEHFFRLMGTRVEDHLDLATLDPAYRVFGEGYDAPLDVRSGRAAVVDLFESVEPGAGAAISRYLDSAQETYDLATESFLYTTFSRLPTGALARLAPRAGTLARLLLESLHARAARTVRDRRLRQVLGYPAVFLGATPRTAPSMFHLMSAMDLDDGVRYPRGGFTTIIEAIERLAREAGVTIRTEAEVTAIGTALGPRGRHVTGVHVGAERLGADLVVSAADLFHTETQLLPVAARTYPESYWRRRTSGPGAVLAYLGIEGALPELRHHNLVFTADWDENFGQVFGRNPRVPEPASFYACLPSASDASVAPPGHENLFLLVPVSPDSADGRSVGAGGMGGAGDREVEAAVDAALATLEDRAGIAGLAERVRVRRTVGPRDFARDFHSWRGNALGPGHTLRQSAFLRGSNASRRVSGLLYAGGTTVPGIGLPMCLISAENVLKRVRRDTSDGPLPEPAAERGRA